MKPRYKVTALKTTTPAEKRFEKANLFTGNLLLPLQEGSSMIFVDVNNGPDIRTSTVQSIEQEGDVITVQTRNTTYKLEPIVAEVNP